MNATRLGNQKSGKQTVQRTETGGIQPLESVWKMSVRDISKRRVMIGYAGLRLKLGMWTEQTRGRMAKIAKKTKRCPSDLTDEEWAQISPLMPKAARRGRRRGTDLREIINAVRYLVRSGCGWRMLPIHFAPW